MDRSKVEISKHHAKLSEATLHPPALPEDAADADAVIPWVLLDLEAYVADHRRNRTTAFSHTASGTEIQVTFFLARPPHVSYFCVFCPGRDHTEIPVEPQILAMDDNLVLLLIVVGPEDEIYKDCGLYIYQANGADDGGPSLERLQSLPSPGWHCCFGGYEKVGLLRCGRGGGTSSNKKDEFIIAALCDDLYEPAIAAHLPDDVFKPGSESSGHTRFALYVYDSKPKSWTVNLVSLDRQQQQKQPGDLFLHFNSKAIAIGGEAGTMGFVDLWRGILLCDVLNGDPNLRYIPLPKPIRPGREFYCDAPLYRDIAVTREKERINFIDLLVKFKPGLIPKDGRYNSDGWMARRFCRPLAAASSVDAANSVAEDWSMECEIKTSDEVDVSSNPHYELLPKPLDSDGRPLPPFKSIVVCRPALGLGSHDDTVHFMIKDVPRDDKAWVIAVKMNDDDKKLLGAAKFAAERSDVVTFAYVHSRISEYLTGASGTK